MKLLALMIVLAFVGVTAGVGSRVTEPSAPAGPAAAEPLNLTVTLTPRTLNLASRGEWVTLRVTAGTGDLGLVDPDSAAVEGGLRPILWSRGDGVLHYKLDRGVLVDRFAAMDPARIVGGYNMAFTILRTDGTPVRASVNVQFEDHRPALLVADVVATPSTTTAYLIGRNLAGGNAVKEVLLDGTPVSISAGPEEADYPGVGRVQVMAVDLPKGFVGGTFEARTRAGVATNTRDAAAPVGGTGTAAPRIFLLLPSSGPAFMPLGISGTDFDVGAIPYVNGVPSISLFNWSVVNVPLIGSIGVGFTIVPPAAPSGSGDVVVEYQNQRSNPFPFTVN